MKKIIWIIVLNILRLATACNFAQANDQGNIFVIGNTEQSSSSNSMMGPTQIAENTNVASAFTGLKTENNRAAYPNVWSRKGPGQIFYPPKDDSHFLLPNGLPDVLIYRSMVHVDGKKTTITREIETFFAGKLFKVKDLDSHNLATLTNGEKIQLHTLPLVNNESQSLVFFIGNELEKEIGDEKISLSDGTAIGRESFTYDSDDIVLPNCEPVKHGVVKVNREGRAIWRHSITELLPLNATENLAGSRSNCLLIQQQRHMSDVGQLHLLPDGTILVDLMSDFMVETFVRIDPNTGRSPHLPDLVHIEDTVNLLQFQNALKSRLENDNTWSGFIDGKYPQRNKSEPIYYLMLQYFLFPSLLETNKYN